MVNEQLKQFADIVKDMRAAQRDYFRTRDPYHLKASKAYEKEVDDLVKQILEPDTQKKLF